MSSKFPLIKLQEAAYATLAWFDLFDYPLSLEELQTFLLGSCTPQKKLKNFLKNDPKISFQKDHFFLKGREEILTIHQQRTQFSQNLWKKIGRFLPFIQMIPFIRMVSICNTIAFNNADQESDIDLFIITQKNRLFIARTFATLLFTILGIRRHGKKIAGRFCLSFYISEDALDLKNIQIPNQDIYLVYWITTLKTIYGGEVYKKFLQENEWVQGYFQHELEPNTASIQKDSWFKKIGAFQEFLLRGTLGNWLEKKLLKMQQKRHQKKFTKLGPEASIVISSTMLKFHNIDRRKEFAERFRKRFGEIMKN